MRTLPLFILLFVSGCKTADYRDHVDEQIVLVNDIRSCKVHQYPLNDDTIDIVYGTPSDEMIEYYRAEGDSFPNAEVFIGGGCIVSSGDPVRAKVLYCEECRVLERQWRGEHGWPIVR